MNCFKPLIDLAYMALVFIFVLIFFCFSIYIFVKIFKYLWRK